MKNKLLLLLALFACTALFTPAAKAQMNRKSPHDTTTGKIGAANVKIIYGSPAVKGRAIWGGLVPYGKAWRAGADEATLFTTDKDLMIDGKKLPAGTYSLFVTPAQDAWTFTLNSQTGQWGIKHSGEADFDPAKNVLTVTVKPKAAAMEEHLKYKISSGGFGLHWEKMEGWVMAK